MKYRKFVLAFGDQLQQLRELVVFTIGLPKKEQKRILIAINDLARTIDGLNDARLRDEE